MRAKVNELPDASVEGNANGLAGALCAWRDAIGDAYVQTDEASLRQVETATFGTGQEVPAIISPANREEVQQCVRIANHYRVPIYPISTGKNWGYGSRVPVRSGCVVMSLARLNRIVDFNEELAYITVEPGVTFREVNKYLAKQDSGLMVSVTGSTIDASLIGNAMERGLGIGAYGDRAAHACDLEVVLATGEVLRTGFGRYSGAAAGVSSWGVGPSLDGLFTQSNLGIVTRMTFWLMPRSAHRHSVYFTVTHKKFEPLVDALRRLRLLRICDEPIRLYNDYKTLSGTIQFPRQAAQDPGFISQSLMASIREALSIGAWCGEIYFDADSEDQCTVQQELVYATLKDLADTLYFVDYHGTRRVPTKGSEETGELRLEPSSDVEQAHHLETPGGIRSVYWRKKSPVPEDMDPDLDACGVFWCAPAVPLTGSHVAQAVGCMENIMLAAHYEPIISIILLTERLAIVNASLVYDREEPGEDERALECYHTLLRKLLDLGYVPYRLGIQSMDSLPDPSGDYSAVMARIKSAVDPNNILAPGRYS